MRYLAALLLLFCCASAIADDAGERAMLAQRLTDLLEVKASNRAANGVCAKSPAEMARFIRDLYIERPGNFNGVSPQSAYWPEVEETYRNFYAAVCASSMIDAVESAHVAAFSTMPLADLRAAVAFYSSSAGQQMKLSMKKALPDLNAMMNRGADDEMKAAQERFQKSMLQLKKKYAADPK